MPAPTAAQASPDPESPPRPRRATRHACPRCGHGLVRQRRSAAEPPAPAGMGRYRCVHAGCGWSGLQSRTRRQRLRAHRARHARHPTRPWVLGLTVLLLVGLALAVMLRVALGGDTPPRAPLGESHYGRPLPAAHPLQVRFIETLAAQPPGAAPTGLTLRRQCLWGRPGGNPYQGSVEQALQAASLPPEVVQAIAGQVREGRVADRLTIAADGIRAAGSGRVFAAQGFAMTYGRTLCLDTRVNFAPGHTEPAALYEARDAGGRLYAVMVPEVCGNVSVIGQDRKLVQRSLLTGEYTPEDVRWMPAQLSWDPTSPRPRGDGSNGVPLPGTAWLALLALGVLVLAGARRARRSA